MLICCDGLFWDVDEQPVTPPCYLSQDEKGDDDDERDIEYERM